MYTVYAVYCIVYSGCIRCIRCIPLQGGRDDECPLYSLYNGDFCIKCCITCCIRSCCIAAPRADTASTMVYSAQRRRFPPCRLHHSPARPPLHRQLDVALARLAARCASHGWARRTRPAIRCLSASDRAFAGPRGLPRWCEAEYHFPFISGSLPSWSTSSVMPLRALPARSSCMASRHSLAYWLLTASLYEVGSGTDSIRVTGTAYACSTSELLQISTSAKEASCRLRAMTSCGTLWAG